MNSIVRWRVILPAILTSASNIPALLKTIESLSLTEKAELANKARARIKEKYNWEEIAESYLKLLETDRRQ